MCTTLACCAAQQGCACATRGCNAVGGSSKKAAQVMYTVIIILGAVTAFILKMAIPKQSYTQTYLANMVGIKCDLATNAAAADACFGNFAVYRISFALVVFFGLMCIIAPMSRQFHIGWWGLKFPLAIILIIVSFFMEGTFFDGYEDAARVVSVFFLMLQIIIFIGFAFDVNEYLANLAAKDDEDNQREPALCSNKYRCAFIFLGVGSLILSIVACGVMLNFWDCGTPKAYVGMTIVFNIVAVAITLLSEKGGLVTSGIVTLYISWMCYSALSSYKTPASLITAGKATCNPFESGAYDDSNLSGMAVGIVISIITLAYTSYSAAAGGYGAIMITGEDDVKAVEEAADKTDKARNGDTIDPSGPRSSLNQGLNVDPADLEAASLAGDKTVMTRDGREVSVRDAMAALQTRTARRADIEAQAEDKAVRGCCGGEAAQTFIFHLIMITASFYLSMVLTNWADADSNGSAANVLNGVSSSSFAVKSASMFITMALYIWTQVAPMCCPNREFA